MTPNEGGPQVKINLLEITILYLVACLAGVVNLYVGVTAFVCVTVLVIAFLLAVTHKRGEE